MTVKEFMKYKLKAIEITVKARARRCNNEDKLIRIQRRKIFGIVGKGTLKIEKEEKMRFHTGSNVRVIFFLWNFEKKNILIKTDLL